MQLEFGNVFFMKVVGNHIIFPPIKFQSIWITRARDMANILSSAAGGRGGYPSSSCLDDMSLLTSELEQVFSMKVVGNCCFLPPTKFHVIFPSRTLDMGKSLSSVWAGLQDRL
jgi:hypothetical protein